MGMKSNSLHRLGWDGKRHFNDVFSWSEAEQLWRCWNGSDEDSEEKVSSNSEKPFPRRGCLMFEYQNEVYVFGGTNGRYRRQANDMFLFNLETKKWKLMETSGKVPECYRHGGVVFQDQLYVFGGCGEGSKLLPSDVVFILDLKSRAWQTQTTKGEIPLPREGMTCSLWKHFMVVLAGSGPLGGLNDLLMLDLNTLTWVQYQLKEDGVETSKFPSLFLHSAQVCGDDLVVFGGRIGLAFSNVVYVIHLSK